ncbi:MAG: hypothetical protein F6K47_33795 [Symploca sp. SIO2E6]|nr:hypothetical protein [Symploca sp. SIO2E6]
MSVGNWELGIGNWELGIVNFHPLVLRFFIGTALQPCSLAALQPCSLLPPASCLLSCSLLPIPHKQYPQISHVISTTSQTLSRLLVSVREKSCV